MIRRILCNYDIGYYLQRLSLGSQVKVYPVTEDFVMDLADAWFIVSVGV